MNRFEDITIKCQRLNIEVSASKKFSRIPDGNSHQIIEKDIGNICNNIRKCQYYNKCKICNFEPIN